VNIRDLQYLVALADCGHFGKAAESCFVSQPTLSIQIKKLEQYLDLTLIERTNKSVLLTDNGLLIAAKAREILNQVEDLKELAKAAKDPFSGELRLGIFPSLAPYLLPYIMPSISTEFPKLSLYLVEEKTDTLIEKIKSGALHAAILAMPVLDTNLKTTFLFEEEYLLTVPHQHPLAKRKTIKQSDLKNENLLLLEDGHCMREQVLSFCQKSGAGEAKNFRATSLETLRHVVAAGAGITLMPKLSTVGSQIATFIAFDAPKPARKIGLVYKTCTSKSVLMQALEKSIKKILQKSRYVKVIE
jgi:LysR family transcriptional regulator, hydrogen peroxide-inducible genes activator